MSAPRLEDLGTWTDKLPSLPEVVHYLMRSLSDESADIDTLARALEGFIADGSAAAAAGKSARDFAKARFGLERFLAEWDDLVDECCR